MASRKAPKTREARRARAFWTVCAVVVAALLMAGCTDPAGEPTSGSTQDPTATSGPPASPSPGATVTTGPGPRSTDGISINGHVFDEAYRPIEGAKVRMLTVEAETVTDASGAFDLGTHDRGIYPIRVAAPGHKATNHSVLPEASEGLRIVLQEGMPVVAYTETWKFEGILQCAFEALIISPSCDSLLVAGGMDPLFGTNQSFLFDADPGWKTIVVDVDFEPDAHPGLDGLRIAIRGTMDPDGGGEYQQYGRWHDSQPFTARIEPGGNYTDGVEPVPEDATGFQVDVYPHSHAYHPGGAGFLGVGAALDVEFQVYVNVFYVEPAPEGYSFLDP